MKKLRFGNHSSPVLIICKVVVLHCLSTVQISSWEVIKESKLTVSSFKSADAEELFDWNVFQTKPSEHFFFPSISVYSHDWTDL